MINSPARKNAVKESSIVRAMNDTLLQTLNQWCAAQDTPELSFRLKQLPTPIPNKTYYLNYSAILEQYVTVIRGKPAFILSYDEEIVPTLATQDDPDTTYRGDAIRPMTLCGSLFAPVDPKKIPVKDEPAFFGNNLTFDEIRKHLAEKGYANVASSRFLARKRSTPPETTKYFDSLPVDRVFTKDSPKRSGIILPFTNSNHETVAYQVIFDKYVNSISGTSCEESPNATYVGSAREIYTDRKSLYGAYCLLGKAYNPEEKEIWVVEDYAAGASLLEMNPAACVVMCGLSSNLSACVETLFKQYARNEFEGLEQIVIFANNDLSAYYGMLNSAKADQAVNAGIFAAVETYEVYRNNALGVGIAVCAIPDALALEHTAKDFDCLRQCLALENKTLSTSWRDYEADILAYLEDTNSFCAPEKAAIFKTKVEVKTKESSLSRRDYLIKLEKKLSEVVTRVSTVHKVDEARLSDTVGDMLSESKGMVYVQSAMGTGKTYQLKRMIRKVCSRGENVLYLIPSLSLHKQLIKDFREMGLNVVDYQDLATEKKEGGNFHKPHVAVCVINSTAKFREGNYSTIVMDESDQCLHNVIRLLESPFDFTKGFSSMLNKADRVIACYAQLSTLSTDYLNSLRKEKGILILNSFKPAEHKTVHMMPTVVSTYKVIRDLLRKEKKLLIVSNSSQETKRIKHLIDEFDLGTRLFLLNDAENSGRIVEFMSDINTQIKDYDVVIASPKLSSGVSIDVDHFDAIVGVYLTANERMGSVLSNVQQLGRARSVTELYVYTAPRVNYFLPTDLKELTRAQKKHTQAYAPSFTANDTGVIVSDVNMYEAYASLHFGSMAMRNLLDQNQQACTEFLLEQQGYQIKKLTKKEAELIVSDGEIKELKELCARVREQVKYEDAQALAYCASIDSETYTKLSMSKYPTKEEKLKCKRFEIEEFIGQKAMPEDIAAWENHLVCKINWLELLNTPEAKVKEDDTKAFEFAREKKKVIEFLSNGARKKFLTIMHSVYFEKDGTPVKEVSLQSPRVTKAVARLKKLSDKVELYRFGSSVASWEKNPMMYINNAMKKMGFIFTVTRRRVVGEIVHFYSCQIDPTLVPYLEQRKEIAATRTSKSAKPFNPSRITSQVSQKYRQLKWKAEDTDATVSMPTPLSRKAAAKQKEAAEKARLMEKAHQKEMEELEELEASEYWADEVFGDEAESCRPNYPSKLKLQTKAQMKAALEKDKRAILLSR